MVKTWWKIEFRREINWEKLWNFVWYFLFLCLFSIVNKNSCESMWWMKSTFGETPEKNNTKNQSKKPHGFTIADLPHFGQIAWIHCRNKKSASYCYEADFIIFWKRPNKDHTAHVCWKSTENTLTFGRKIISWIT